MLKFISKTSLLSKKVSEAPKYIKKLGTSDLFLVYDEFDKFITIIFQIFENKDSCRKSRLYQNFIYMLFLDLIKIYNVFYIMVTEILDRFKRMKHKEMERSYEIYKAFLGFTENVKKEANSIPLVFGFVFKNPSYYTPDPKLEKTLQRCMQNKEYGGAEEDFDAADFGMGGDDFEAEDVYENRGFEQGGDSDEEDDDDIGGIDILGDVKQAEQFATHAGPGPSRRSTGAVEEQKVADVNLDEFNTAALDDLLGGGAPQRSSDTMVNPSSGPGLLDTADPFSGGNQFSDGPKPESTVDDMFGDAPKQEPVNDGGAIPLDELMGGGPQAEPAKENVAQNDAVPSGNPAGGDFDKLKALYSTPAPSQQPMGMGQPQPGAFHTGMPMGGMQQPMGGMGMQPMGGMGMQ